MAANRVSITGRAESLDNRLRHMVKKYGKILKPYMDESITVVGFGCGPRFWTLDMAKLVGPSGRVIGCKV
jgi:hypothetical protein